MYLLPSNRSSGFALTRLLFLLYLLLDPTDSTPSAGNSPALILCIARVLTSIRRIVESTLRTANNLLERLHASFFFYILTGPYRFLKIGLFLPSAILISVAMMFSGLKIWTDAGWVRDDSPTDSKTNPPQEQWTTRKRPVLSVLRVMVSTHIIGALVFWLITRSVVINSQSVSLFLSTKSINLDFGVASFWPLSFSAYRHSRRSS